MGHAFERSGPDEAARAAGRKRLYLGPGEVFASAEPVLVSTVLGSCVSVCLFDKEAAVGGMNHFLLPHEGGSAAASPRFGPAAVAELLRRLELLGGRRPALEAKVFGGSCVLAGQPVANAVGAKNVRVALRLLAESGIPVAAQETGGERGRRLLYETDTGCAWVRRI